MTDENTTLSPVSASDDDESVQENIDLNELADRIVALLLKEISIEVERTGR